MQAQGHSPSALSFQGNRAALYVGVAATILIVIAGAVVALTHLRHEAETRVATTTQNMARSLEQTIEGMIDTIDVALLAAGDEVGRQMSAGKPDGKSITRFLIRQQQRLTLIDSMRATNERGDIIYGPEVLSPPIKAHDREYFTTLRDDPKLGLFISKPFVGRLDNRWVWLFARRINKPDGSFGGVVFARMQIDHLEQMLAKIKMESGSAIALRDTELGLIARNTYNSANPIPPGDKRLSTPFKEALKANREEGTYVSDKTVADGISRTYSYRRSPKYGFTILVGITRDAAMADWQQQTGVVSGLVAAFVLALLALLRQAGKSRHRQAQDMAVLEASRESLQEAQNIANLGQFAYDLRTNCWTSSNILDDIFGIGRDYPRDARHWLELVAPGYRQEMQLYLKNVVEQRLPFDREYCIVRPGDGHERWLHGMGKLQLDGQGNPVALIGTIQDITERKQAQQTIQESEKKYRTLFESANDGIFLQDATGFLDCNQKGASMYGLAKQDLIGRSPADLCPERQPDGRLSSEVVAENIAAAMRGETPCFEWQPLRVDGTPFDVEVTLNLVEYRGAPCLQAIVRDISKRKEAEKALSLSESRFRHISSISSDLIYSCFRSDDGLFRVDWIGGNAQGIFGVDIRELKALSCWRSFVVPEDIPLFSANITGLTPGQQSDIVLRVTHRDGSVHYARSVAQVEDDPDGHGRHRLYGALQDVTERKTIEAELREMAVTDTLTGLPNRRHFMARLEEELARVLRLEHQLAAVLMIDLDHFKHVNDTYGHLKGDGVLRHFASLLREGLRKIDTGGRIGGEEFAVILPGADMEAAEAFAERLRHKLAQTPSTQDDLIIPMTVSIGIADINAADGSPDVALSRADEALYRAKSMGRNCVVRYDRSRCSGSR